MNKEKKFKCRLKSREGRSLMQRATDYDLINAILEDNLRDLKMALLRGANPNSEWEDYPSDVSWPTTNYGARALSIAIITRRYDAAKELIQYGAELNYIDSDGHTPITEAAKRNNSDVIKCLAAHGAEVDFINRVVDSFDSHSEDIFFATKKIERRETALMWAARHTALEALETLLELGAYLDYEDGYGHSAKSVASKASYAFLEKYENETPVYHKISDCVVIQTLGGFRQMGALKKIFNFEAQTVTESFDQKMGPPQGFDRYQGAHDEIVQAYNWIKKQDGQTQFSWRPEEKKKGALAPEETLTKRPKRYISRREKK